MACGQSLQADNANAAPPRGVEIDMVETGGRGHDEAEIGRGFACSGSPICAAEPHHQHVAFGKFGASAASSKGP